MTIFWFKIVSLSLLWFLFGSCFEIIGFLNISSSRKENEWLQEEAQQTRRESVRMMMCTYDVYVRCVRVIQGNFKP